MPGPFSSVTANGRPSWGVVSAEDGNFSVVDVAGGVHTPEVGYDEGGYSEGGYDTPNINIPGTAQPIWTEETTK